MITKDMKIIEALQLDRRTAFIFQGFGMGCIHWLNRWSYIGYLSSAGYCYQSGSIRYVGTFYYDVSVCGRGRKHHQINT